MKKIYTLLIITILLFSIIISNAQNPPIAHAVLDINDISARINACGNHFYDFIGYPHFDVPKNSGKCTIFSSALWIGGYDNQNTLYLSAERFRQIGTDFSTGPLRTDGTASSDSVTINNWNRLWVIDRSEIDQFIQCHNNPSSCPGYIIPNSILDWPAHGNVLLGQSHNLAPFVDVNNDGQYNPIDGDYPRIRGDRTIFFIFNDSGEPNTESDGTPLGIEVQAMAYAFNCPQNDAFNHTIFMNYKIINRSTRNYYYTYIGLFTDFDIGYHLDDYVGCDVARGSYYGYNGDAIDGDTCSFCYGALPPAQSVTILAGPLKYPDGIDNPKYDSLGNQICNGSINGFHYEDGIVDNERFGLSSFTYFNNSTAGAPPYMQDPDIAIQYYNYLSGLWKDGSQMLYGGNAHTGAGAYGPGCSFMFPGDSDPCNWGTGGVPPNGPVYWTEETANNQPNDRRGLGVTGPFKFLAGATEELDFAFVYGRTTDSTISSVDVMKANIDVVRNAFNNNLSPCGGPMYTSNKEVTLHPDFNLSVYPNPAQNLVNIDFELQKPATVKIDIYDILAKNCVSYQSDEWNTGKSNIKLDISSLKQGVYFVNVNIDKRTEQKKLIIIK